MAFAIAVSLRPSSPRSINPLRRPVQRKATVRTSVRTKCCATPAAPTPAPAPAPAPAPLPAESTASRKNSVRTGASVSGEMLARIDLRRVVSWAALGITLVACRPFFPVMLGTFIVGYVANSVVRAATRATKARAPRRLFVGVFYAVIVTAITGFSLMTVPTVVRESQYFIKTLQSENPYVYVANVMRKSLGDDLATKLETYVVYSLEMPEIEARKKDAANIALPQEQVGEWSEERSRRLGVLIQKSIRSYISGTVSLITRLLSASTKVVFKALLSLVFSFMIMWDLPRIVSGVQRLKNSRVKFMYNEIAPVISQFGSVLGKSFEAQGAIALVNTTLTTAGLMILSVPGIEFLCVVTLFCSFIPVAGVFISTLPMVIIALSEYGAAKAMAVVAMVIIVHLIEAYVLNPQIYSAHLHLHPLFVLIVLYVAEHSYGIPGLLMAVPVAVYLLRTILLPETAAAKQAAEVQMPMLQTNASSSSPTEPQPANNST